MSSLVRTRFGARFLSVFCLVTAAAAVAPLAQAQISNPSPGSINFGSLGQNSQASASFGITNIGTQKVSGTVAPINIPGVTVSPGLFGPLQPGQGANFGVSVDTTGLPPGNYSGIIAIQPTVGGSKSVQVSFSVAGVLVTLTAAPSSETISVAQGSTAQGTPIRVSAQGGTPTTIIATASGAGVSVSGSGNTFTPMVDATSNFGTFGTITFSCSTCQPATVSITINVQTAAAAPMINSFSASPSTITSGQGATLSWSVANATSVVIDNGIGSVNVTAGSATVKPSATTTYTMTASNGSTTTTSTATVVVNNAGPVTTSKVIPQVADGGVWQTTIVLVNRGSTTANAGLSFAMDVQGGAPAPWALQMENSFNYSQIQVAPHSAVWMRTVDDRTTNTIAGYGTLTGDSNIEAFAIFRQRIAGLPDQEGTAIAIAPNNRVLVPFDNTGGHVSVIALVNSGTSSQAVSVTVRTTSGMSTPDTVTIPANGHIAIATATQFPETTGVQGVMELTSSGSPITALALRFNASGAFTTIPVLPGPASSSGTTILSQIADGGGWQSTIVVVNTGSATATAQLSFAQDLAGGVSGPWSPSLNGQVTPSVTIAPGASVFLQTPGTASTLTQGYATVVGDPGIQAFAIFRQRVSGLPDQEGTAVAFAASKEVLVPFDNTGGSVSTAALVNTGQGQSFQASYSGANSSITVAGGAHIPFTVVSQLPSSANQRALADFTSQGSPFSMLGLRFNSTGAFTSLPVFATAQ